MLASPDLDAWKFGSRRAFFTGDLTMVQDEGSWPFIPLCPKGNAEVGTLQWCIPEVLARIWTASLRYPGAQMPAGRRTWLV